MAGGFSDFEQNILSGIEDATGEAFDTGTDDSLDEGDQSLQQQVKQPTNTREQDTEDGGDLLDGSTKQTKQSAVKLGPDGKPVQKKGGPRTNERGDIIDEQGNVIARGGDARRLHSQVTRLREQTKTLEDRNASLASQLAEVQFLNNLPKQYGLVNEEVADGLQIVGQFKTNPAKAAQMVIERALAAGATMAQIVNDEFIPNVQIGAVTRLLDERLGPIAKERQEQQGVDDVNRQGMEAANAFLTDYPEAEIHSAVIADQMKGIMQEYKDRGRTIDPYVAAERALERLVIFADKYGLDINQPLGPQVQAKRDEIANSTNGTGNANGGKGPTQRQSRPMPNGNRGNGVVERKSQSSRADDSMDSIVRDAMAENGITF